MLDELHVRKKNFELSVDILQKTIFMIKNWIFFSCIYYLHSKVLFTRISDFMSIIFISVNIVAYTEMREPGGIETLDLLKPLKGHVTGPSNVKVDMVLNVEHL